MKERPILFSPAMVLAILEGRKTQTRRALRDQKPIDLGASTHGTHLVRREVHDHGKLVGHRTAPVRCPYGEPGDRLWVKERHAFLDVLKATSSANGPRSWYLDIEYSDGSQNKNRYLDDAKKPKQTRQRGELGWRPGIHMPRWASRITLEVVSIRVERVQQISVDDVLAEGVRIPIAADTKRHLLELSGKFPPSSYLTKETLHDADAFVRAHYASLWDSINAKRGYEWSTNPWAWVVEFKRP